MRLLYTTCIYSLCSKKKLPARMGPGIARPGVFFALSDSIDCPADTVLRLTNRKTSHLQLTEFKYY